jgi:hypothetical protein
MIIRLNKKLTSEEGDYYDRFDSGEKVANIFQPLLNLFFICQFSGQKYWNFSTISDHILFLLYSIRDFMFKF